MWEYKRFDISYKTNADFDKELKKIGDDGWEIISYVEVPKENFDRVQRVKLLGKRPKKEEI